MAYYKVIKTLRYTEVLYIEADTKTRACDISGTIDGEVNHDDEWYDSDAKEISKAKFETETEHLT